MGRSTDTLLAFLFASAAFAQITVAPIATGYKPPPMLRIAPGQVVTLYLGGLDRTPAELTRAQTASWPTTLAGISVELRNGQRTFRLPILVVQQSGNCGFPGIDPACGTTTAVTVQMPFDIPVNGACTLEPPFPPVRITVFQNGAERGSFAADRVRTQLHVVRFCDSFFAGTFGNAGCLDVGAVTHGDGSTVDATRPARVGEMLTAYLVGLGQVTTAPNLGQPTPAAVPVQDPNLPVLAFSFGFNPPGEHVPFSCEAGGLPFLIHPVAWAGLTPGFVGLYQVNFVMPPIPNALRACGAGVQWNASVTFATFFSQESVRLCVAP